jgi:hypothetical protein
MFVEYAVVGLDLEPMFGQSALECCCGVVPGVVLGVVRGVVCGVVCGGVVEGVVLPLTADHATPAPIVSAAITTSTITSFIRTMAASFRSPPWKQVNLKEGSETAVSS